MKRATVPDPIWGGKAVMELGWLDHDDLRGVNFFVALRRPGETDVMVAAFVRKEDAYDYFRRLDHDDLEAKFARRPPKANKTGELLWVCDPDQIPVELEMERDSKYVLFRHCLGGFYEIADEPWPYPLLEILKKEVAGQARPAKSNAIRAKTIDSHSAARKH